MTTTTSDKVDSKATPKAANAKADVKQEKPATKASTPAKPASKSIKLADLADAIATPVTDAVATSPVTDSTLPGVVDPASLLQVASPTATDKVADAKPAQVSVSQFLSVQRPVLSVAGNVPNTFDGKVLELRMYGEGCMECGFLIPSQASADDEVPKCHFSCGNVFCPAGHLRVKFVGAQMRLISKLKKAQEKQDVNRISLLMTELDGLDIDSRKEILQEIGFFKSE